MRCRHCHSDLHLSFIDLETSPPSNSYLAPEELRQPEKWYPLRVSVCDRCWLVQTEDYTQHEDMFSADYAYFSSYSSSWLKHASNYVDEVVGRFQIGSASYVVEVASNDGYLLQYMKARDIPCLGIEPTSGTARVARERGIAVVERFFGVALADELAAQGRLADLTIANNVLAHVPDINDFVSGFARLLKPAGVSTFEFPHLTRLVDQCQFDTIYHEHFSYLSLSAVVRIFEANALAVFDVEELSTHGGSLRVFAQRRDSGRREVSPAVGSLLEREAAAGVTSADYYRGFQPRADSLKDDLLQFLIEAKRSGSKVVAYGAAAKGNTLLNYAGVRSNLLPFVVDRNPAKIGRYLPGCRIPVVAEAQLRAARPDVILILPWNLESEVVEQLAYAREWGCRFATAVPRLELK